jgi:peptide-methionine (S)-S-oxide reductase
VHGGSFSTSAGRDLGSLELHAKSGDRSSQFDPARTSYDKLLNLFWRAHDPTEVDAQGPDTGKQYRSAVFFVDEQQHVAAEKSKGQVQKSYSKPIATEITRAGSFRPAPENHQNSCRKNPNNPYVRQIIEPKLKKLSLKKS